MSEKALHRVGKATLYHARLSVRLCGPHNMKLSALFNFMAISINITNDTYWIIPVYCKVL